jgi:hypothetical protein
LPSCLAYLLTLRGGDFPWAIFLLMLAMLVYQIGSGTLLNQSWGVWVTREARSRLYWTMIAVYTAIVAVFFITWLTA